MDFKMIKSAGIAALIISLIYVLINVVPKILFYITGLYKEYYSFFIIFGLINLILPIAHYFLLGLLAVYFFKRYQGQLTSINYIVMIIMAIVFYVVLKSILYVIVDSIFYSPYSQVLPSTITFSVIMRIVTAFLGIVPALIGSIIGCLIFASKEEKKLLKSKIWIPVVIIAFICVVFVIGIIIFWLPPPPPRVAPGCSGFSQVRPIGWKADSSENKMVLVLINEAGVKVRLDDVKVDVFGNPCTIGNLPATLPELRAGQNYQVNITGCTFPDISDYYKAEISISYTNLVSDIKHKSVGECHGWIE